MDADRSAALPETEVARGDAALRKHGQLKSVILDVFATLGDLNHANRGLCRELSAKLGAERFNLVALGEFKRGKTCLVNALLGESLLPMGVTPLTSVAVVVCHGEQFRATVRYLNGGQQPIGRDEIACYVTEGSNPGNAKQVREVHVELAAPILRDGLQLLDTPGIGSIHGHNTETAYTVLPRCDAAIFLLSADQPVGRAELDFLMEVRRYAQRIFFVLNKIDYLEGTQELAEALDFTRGALSEALGAPVRLFPLSAKRALKGGSWMDPGVREQSGMPGFVSALEDFLVHEKGRFLLLGAIASAERILRGARLELEIATKALSEPPEVLTTKLNTFRAQRDHLRADRRRLGQDFEGRAGRLIEGCLDPEISFWQKSMEDRLHHRFEAYVAEIRDEGLPRALDEALAAFISAEVGAGIAALYAQGERSLTDEFNRAARNFATAVGVLVSDLHRFAAGLFELDGLSTEESSRWMPESHCTLAFDFDPGGLEILSELAVKDWPVWLGRRLKRIEGSLLHWSKRRIISRRRRDLIDAIDVNMGRLRYDLLRRVDAACREFARDAFRWYDSSVDGIESTLKTSIVERTRSADFLIWRRRTLERQLALLDAQATRLDEVRREVDSL